MKTKYIYIACRPKQWPKNLLVFAAPLFTFSSDLDIWLNSSISLIAFCLISSSIYLINDSLDIKSDRNHPEKKNRPIASGLITKKEALFYAGLLIVCSLIISKTFVNLSLSSVILIYLLIQLCYCIRLKNEPILDLFCISSGFLLRAIAGGVAANLAISPWFLLTIGLLALFLAVEKRKAELRISSDNSFITRKVLEKYSLPLLLRLENLSATSSFIAYSLWASGPTLNGAPNSLMLITVPFVLLGIFRYQLISEPMESNFNGLSSEKPEEILLKDKGIQMTIIGWVITTLLIGLFGN